MSQSYHPNHEGGGKGRESGGGERSAPRKKPHILLRAIKFLFQLVGTLLLVGIVTAAFLACYATVYIQTVIMPQARAVLAGLDAYQYDENSVIYYYDQQGNAVELQTLVGEKNSEWVDFEDIPKNLINATVAVEDQRFWTHPGVDWKRTAAGIVYMFTGQAIQGGSTITQQLIKNVTTNDDVTVKRKILEIFTALEFQKKYDKNYTLTWYLNEIYLGAGCNGVKTAAVKYFGKELEELSVAECASLISITNNPSLYGPYSTLRVTLEDGTVKTAVDYNKERQEVVLWCMWDQGYITETEYRQALKEELVFAGNMEQNDTNNGTEYYSWYVEAVIDEVFEDLRSMEEYKNLSDKILSHMVYSGGLSIYTCFDPQVQAAVDLVYENPENLDYTSSTGQKMRSAITVVDNQSGYVVAIGNTREKDTNRGWNDATDSKRQPGSSIKPLASYSPAIELGLINMGTVVDDNPTTLNGKVWPKNSPQGYDGLMTVLQALTKSKNTVAVQIMKMLTPEVSFEFLTEKYGLTTLAEMDGYNSRGEPITDIGLSNLALGGLQYGVTTYEMAAAYATFPRMGTYTEPTTYLAIYTDDGKTLLRDNTPEKQYIIEESTAYYMNTMLTNAVRSGTGTSARLNNMAAAGKTGTTNNNYDRWFAGYTPYYTAVVWTGYNKPEYMSVGSKNPAAVLWQKVMTEINGQLELEEASFPQYTETVTKKICLDCGQLATDRCGLDVRGGRTASYTFARGDEPKESCTCHVTVEVCKECPMDGNAGLYHLTTEYCPAESRIRIALVDYNRELANSGVVVRDAPYLLANFEAQAQPCTVHDWLSQFIPEPDIPDSGNNSGEGEEGLWPWPWPWESEEPVQTEDPFAWPSDYDPTASLEPIPSESQPPVETPQPVDPGEYWDYPWEQG